MGSTFWRSFLVSSFPNNLASKSYPNFTHFWYYSRKMHYFIDNIFMQYSKVEITFDLYHLSDQNLKKIANDTLKIDCTKHLNNFWFRLFQVSIQFNSIQKIYYTVIQLWFLIWFKNWCKPILYYYASNIMEPKAYVLQYSG